MRNHTALGCSAWLACLLASCGGGGSGAGAGSPNTLGADPPWTVGVFKPSADFAARCAAPRSGIDPTTHVTYPDVRGSADLENNWLRSWTNELYLWYREVPDDNPGAFATPAYFDLLRTSATTASGAAKDKFHFTYPTATWEKLSQSGVQVGYGAQWAFIAASPPRKVVVAYIDPGYAATAAALARGGEVLAIDGVDAVNAADQASVDKLNAGLAPAAAGESHSFLILDEGAPTPRSVTMIAANVTSTPVQNVSTITTSSGTAGYMLFNDHLATSEAALVSAFTTLQADGVSDLVLDIRYNGGGFLDIASEVAFMIAGPGATAAQTFELTQFNDKYPTTDPLSGQPIVPVPFHSTTQGFGALAAGQALPTLNLSRVFVLTTDNTCSASESIINSLRGVNVTVIQVGATTCGKPYGFYPADNCGTTYFSIQFRGVNAQGFGDYPDGFSPSGSAASSGAELPGCAMGDDFSHALGDPAEHSLAAALMYLNTGTCPAPLPTALGKTAQMVRATGGARVYKTPWLENRILRR
jgi:carboxyl-terminal processing protease